jgi:hypothetical protein
MNCLLPILLACLCTGPATRPKPTVVHDVRIILAHPPESTWQQVTFRAPDASRRNMLNDYANLVREELARHAPALLARAKLRAAVIVDELAVDGQRRAAVPDYPNGCLYLDPSVGAHNEEYQRHVIHHELFHFIQGRFRKDAYFKDPDWLALNAPGAQYGNGGARTRGHDVYELTHPAAGFVNLYSQSAVEEDMAEIFAVLHVETSRRKAEEWAKHDAALRAKVHYMQALIESYTTGKD